jgi:hypothetical protein
MFNTHSVYSKIKNDRIILPDFKKADGAVDDKPSAAPPKLGADSVSRGFYPRPITSLHFNGDSIIMTGAAAADIHSHKIFSAAATEIR